MLRQRPRQVNTDAHEKQGVLTLDSDEQDKVIAALGEEAKQQHTMFNVSLLQYINISTYHSSHKIHHQLICKLGNESACNPSPRSNSWRNKPRIPIRLGRRQDTLRKPSAQIGLGYSLVRTTVVSALSLWYIIG